MDSNQLNLEGIPGCLSSGEGPPCLAVVLINTRNEERTAYETLLQQSGRTVGRHKCSLVRTAPLARPVNSLHFSHAGVTVSCGLVKFCRSVALPPHRLLGKKRVRAEGVQSSEFIRAKTTANQLDWPYKPCLASSGLTPLYPTTCSCVHACNTIETSENAPVPAAVTQPYGRAWHHARQAPPAADA